MTLKTSFFNKGIYKSTVKRHIWGSVVYFLILFFSAPLLLLMDYDINHGGNTTYYADNPIILENTYMIIPLLTSIVAPTIVSVLVFRFLHSKNQAVFIHSLPVSRRANYISSLAAAFTLMGVPVILNGLILSVISLCGYGAYFTPYDCLIWTACNFLGIYMMFSCAVFSANLTGNSFASVAINAIIHLFLFITVSVFYMMAELFLYGFSQPDTLIEIIAENNYAYVTFGMADQYFRENIGVKDLIIYLGTPLLFYVASYFLYKKRKPETASDVAGFKCLNTVFKYGVCFLATMFAFALFASAISESPFITVISILLISIAVYFACEMLLKKSLKVFYAWKGYIAFAAVFMAMVLLFSHTTFFGYETRLPNREDISEVAVYNYYNTEKPFCSNEEVIRFALDTHTDFVQKDTIYKVESSYRSYGTAYTRIHIDYKLKNGKTLLRTYNIPSRQFENLMSELYNIEEYKKIYEPIFMNDSRFVRIRTEGGVIENKAELIDALRKDYLTSSYSDIYHADHLAPTAENTTLYNIWVEYETTDFSPGGEPWINTFHISVNSKFTNTVNLLQNKK